jgi:hypothetical protein
VTPTDDGVSVTVVEGGFAGLDAPDEVKNQSIESNSGGWNWQIDALRSRAVA